MGRRPKASKINNDTILSLAGNALASEGERFEQHDFGEKINPSKVLGSQLQNPKQPMCSPLKHLDSSVVVGLETTNATKSPQEQINQISKHQKKHVTVTKKMSKQRITSVRRSDRIKSGVVESANSRRGSKCVVDVTVSDSEKDEPDTRNEKVLAQPNPADTQIKDVQVLPKENTQTEQVSPQENTQSEQTLPASNGQFEQLLLVQEPAVNLNGKGLDEKVNYALQKIESFDKIVIELLKSKQVEGNVSLYESTLMGPISYRSMYFDSQKKLEAVTVENRVLTGQLETALSRAEMYEKENHVLRELLDKMKDTFHQHLSNVAKTTEAAVIASTQEIDNEYSASAAKRKRIEG